MRIETATDGRRQRRDRPPNARCSGLQQPHIVSAGDPDLVDRFVRPTLAGEKVGAPAVTESGGGSDAARLVTSAVRRTDDTGDHFVVNGANTFITSGIRADFVTTAVRTGGPGHAGISLHGSEVERAYRDVRILGIGAGATEVLNDLTARLLGYTP